MRQLAIAGILALTACGGHVASIDDGDGGAGIDASLESGSDARVEDAGRDTGTSDASYDCAGKLATLDALAQATRKCCPTCNAEQCTIAVKGLCCPISATTAAAAKVMQDAVSEYLSHCGPVACPATPCLIAPSKICDPSTSLCR